MKQKKHLDGYAGRENAVIADFLVKLGGISPAGYPNYRLVESDRILEKIGGLWHDWDENLDVSERTPWIRKQITVREDKTILGPNGQQMPVDVQKSIILPGNAPRRIAAEVRELPKYGHLETQGWILEKFYPAEMFGSQDFWYSIVVPGTTIPRLGPYPEKGVYEMIAGVFPTYPELSFLEQFIGYHTRKSRERMESDAKAVAEEKIARMEAAEQEKADNTERRVLELIKGPLLGTSLAAGRLRNEMAERAGIRSHMGN